MVPVHFEVTWLETTRLEVTSRLSKPQESSTRNHFEVEKTQEDPAGLHFEVEKEVEIFLPINSGWVVAAIFELPASDLG